MVKSPKIKAEKNRIDEDLVRKLAALLDETGLSEIDYSNEGFSIRIARHSKVSRIEAQPTQPDLSPLQIEPDLSSHPGVVTAPMVGVAFLLPDPTSEPFIQVGDEVSKGQTLFLIEAMKVFNTILAPKDGRIARILIENETPVEYGEPLAIIE
tara:strand:- start:508 stop:966 length:459 start_codon:yes stop_codon:yes gene_type:complete